MKYIVKTIEQMIETNEPKESGEAIILINGFNNLVIYENIARTLQQHYNQSPLSAKIKLAKHKWEQLSKDFDTSICQSMLQNDWVAEAESVTFYRNQHDSNILILMGTEDEEDTGGLLNCYSITPDKLIFNVNKKYFGIFEDCFNYACGDNDIAVVNKAFDNLFEFVAPDICKLSELADNWEDQFDSINEFIEAFYSQLNIWGMPNYKLKPVGTKKIVSDRNHLRPFANFINRKEFDKLSNPKYVKHTKQIKQYQDVADTIDWDSTAFNGYGEFSETLLEYIRGEKVKDNRNKLLSVDFSIIEEILGLKIDSDPKPTKAKDVVILGNPITVIAKSLLDMLGTLKELDVDGIEAIQFSFDDAYIVSGYTDTDDEEKKEILYDIWKNVCVHVNGIIEYFDSSNNWLFNGNEISIKCATPLFFDPKEINSQLENTVNNAAGTNTLNRIRFSVCATDTDGNAVVVYDKQTGDEEPVAKNYEWKFKQDASWLHDYSDLITMENAEVPGVSFIPFGTINKINTALVVKSEEEFFDFYEENSVNLSFDLITYIRSRLGFISGINTKALFAYFEDLANSFGKFVNRLATEGIYCCLKEGDVSTIVGKYNTIAEKILQNSFAEADLWMMDAFLYSFCIIENANFIDEELRPECIVVPPWHPAALQIIADQQRFIVDGLGLKWNEIQDYENKSRYSTDNVVNYLIKTTEIQSTLDIFPTDKTDYFGLIGNYGNFSIYGDSSKAVEVKARIKDLIKKEAIYDDEFSKSEFTEMNDDAKMIFDILKDYNKALPSARRNLCISFINPPDLQPIIASIHKYTEGLLSENPDQKVNIRLRILVRPENKGGRNYLTYWMDDYFTKEKNLSVSIFLNEWTTKNELEHLLNTNNDIIFNMDLLHINTFNFVQNTSTRLPGADECRFPIVYKPSPLSITSKKRKIELSQPQFSASFNHTQVARYCKQKESIPVSTYIAVRESSLEKDVQGIIDMLHKKSYWVVCVDRAIDGALLRSDGKNKNYSVIGFSTGKGLYGQYNLTITAKNSILETVEAKLANKLYGMFHWDNEILKESVQSIIGEAKSLDGISLLSAINPNDRKINEFMAYVMTSLRERNAISDYALRVIVHLDSYLHWFKNIDDSSSRPDFLMLSISDVKDKLIINATVIECKTALAKNMNSHITKAHGQVLHGINQLSALFDPASTSLERRYWYAQLYRALVFAQVSFSDNSDDFIKVSEKLREVLDGNFEIEWNGKILGFSVDSNDNSESSYVLEDGTEVCNIPQKEIQRLLLNKQEVDYVDLDDTCVSEYDGEGILSVNVDVMLQKELEERAQRVGKMEEQFIEIKDGSINVVENSERIEDEKPEHAETNGKNEVGDDKNIESSLDNISSDENKKDEETVSHIHDDDENKSLINARIKVGVDKNNADVFWEYGNPGLANRHLLITGTSGQGKTYSIQTLLYEASKSNISTVVFDYTEGFRMDQLEPKFLSKMEKNLDERIVYFTGVPINPFKRYDIEVAGIKAPEKISDVAQRIANILTHVYEFGEQQFSAIYEACRAGIEKHGENMSMQYLEDELKQSTNKAAKTVISKMAPFIHSVEFSNENFDWNSVLYSDEGKLTIFQLTNFVRVTQVIITEFMLWDMWHFTKKYGSKDKPFVTVLDEAQNLDHSLSSPSGMILTEGRKFGWSAWYATQSMKILSDDEIVRLMQSAFKLYFKPTDDEIIKMAKQLNVTDPNEWKTPLTNLKKGECIVVGSRIQKNGKFGVGKPTITHISAFENRE